MTAPLPERVRVGKVELTWAAAGYCYLADTGNSVMTVSQTMHAGQAIGWTAVATADKSRIECFRIASPQAAADALAARLVELKKALEEVLG